MRYAIDVLLFAWWLGMLHYVRRDQAAAKRQALLARFRLMTLTLRDVTGAFGDLRGVIVAGRDAFMRLDAIHLTAAEKVLGFPPSTQVIVDPGIDKDALYLVDPTALKLPERPS